jgi:glycosyltransferase involved in cell wall biosynthesis
MSARGTGPAVEPELAFCTIISKNYLASARALAESLRRHCPEAPFFVLLADCVDGYFDPRNEPFTLTQIEELPIPDLPRFCFQYSVVELNTAAKPYFMANLFAEHGVCKLIYLDPDILVLHGLEPLADLLGRYPIVLTPHVTQPYPYRDDCVPNEAVILRAGTFNLGFLGLADGPTAARFLDWWKDRLYTGCKMDPYKGYHVDQKWIDLIPSYFAEAFILRDPGYNVAYWNLHNRCVTVQDGRVQVNGGPCYFFHFSGFNPLDIRHLSRYQNRLGMAEIGDVRILFQMYAERLLAHGYMETCDWPYAFGCFDNGVPIPQELRRHYLQMGQAAERFGNPFETTPPSSLYCWWALRQKELPARACPDAPASVRPWGVNLAGYLRSEKGVGEAARAVVRSLEAAGIPYVLNEVHDEGSANREESLRLLSTANPHNVNLVQVNADRVPLFAQTRPDYFKGHYNVGYWNWELSTFPDAWRDSFRFFDEIWVPSTFTQAAVAAAAPVPVRRVPFAIEVLSPAHANRGRSHFDLPNDAFLFLFVFDYRSYLARKNPLAVIETFQRAFGDDSGVALVLKSVHGRDVAEASAAVRAACGRQTNIRMIDEIFGREETHALMLLCDAYVSLHRSEGFGLTLAEAMAMGKPVIATGYSGNADFMTVENSLPVRYRLANLEQDHGPYPRGAVWAEPDLNHALKLMRRIAGDSELAQRLGERARSDITRELRPARIGEVIRSRLLALVERRLPTESVAPPVTRSIDAWRPLQDITQAEFRSHRRFLGGLATASKRMLLRWLRPVLERQSAHNASVGSTFAGLMQRVERQEREIIELERLLLQERLCGHDEGSKAAGPIARPPSGAAEAA